ncbi:NADH-quinone oxidoreductase subunit C [Ornatilinea apprima]|uniref:NADH-quinone oxidoreductase subunit C n=1 Tax=Ornatilinea apprima TaxID=1134406 RepID=UPI00094658CB|nr:NADH-quinone oxidoreductase subunit C [Ornatilinea apprima]
MNGEIVMNELIQQVAKLVGEEQAQVRSDGVWIMAGEISMQSLAEFSLREGFRLSTMTAVERPEGETDVIYHFINNASLLHVRIQSRGQHLESLAAFLPSANWIEREIRDLYAVQFDGHPDPRPLLRPKELPEGFFRKAIADAILKEREAK